MEAIRDSVTQDTDSIVCKEFREEVLIEEMARYKDQLEKQVERRKIRAEAEKETSDRIQERI